MAGNASADAATFDPHEGYRVPEGTEMTGLLLSRILSDYRSRALGRLATLRRAYEGDHDVLRLPRKAAYKPDNRLVANYARQIVDSMVGYFLGMPVRVAGDDKEALAWLAEWSRANDVEDLDAELSKVADVYGSAFEVMWRDGGANPRSSVVTPVNCLVIRDDTVEGRILWAVRFWRDDNRFDGRPDAWRGTLYDSAFETPFEWGGAEARFGEPVAHGFPDVPVVEYVDNEERQGLFEGVLSLIDAHDRALSEKANDVEYYADAYLKVTGAKLDEKTLRTLRDSRIINLAGTNSDKVVVEFLSKPDADGTQEHLIDRLERLIFTLSMVSDLSSESFDTSSGIAIKYRLQAMSDLAKVKERKFRRSLTRRWRLLFGYAACPVADDAWMGLRATFTANLPSNLLEESQVAGNLSGITSRETQLSVLSCVDDPHEELDRIEGEAESSVTSLAPPRGGQEA